MEMYNVPKHGNTETYVIQGTESNPYLTSPFLEQVEAMYPEGNLEFVVDQGLYYPAATNYGYYCTGFESPGEWEDHHRVFGVDGPDIQYTGTQSENFPYVYYPPTYGYAQSPYNPYNPYIPGAMIGVDSPFVGPQQYYSFPPYQNPASSPAFVPFIVQPDIIPNGSQDPLSDTGTLMPNRLDSKILKQSLASASAAFPRIPQKPVLNQTNPLRLSEGPKANVGHSKQPVIHESVSSSSFPTQGRSASGSLHPIDNISSGKILSHRNHLKAASPISTSFSDIGSSALGHAAVDKIHVGRALNDVNGGLETLGEQNRDSRTNRLKNQLAVKAYTTEVGDSNAQGNIIIYTDQYNKDDFPVDYVAAKFFVIKSYSEDDVHKSIKYNVWSSTPHGNKKLEIAYKDAQKIAAGNPKGCPIFLFFSVNASGQFCGVAEMIGPVDFHNDMDFWQQDKWSGSFPVKWHIIKDIPNTNFRHIILVNNESKPVTNSRDTQEIMYKQGLEMLKIFQNHTMKTSLLHDFIYYENRQKIMQEEKARLLINSFESPFSVPTVDPTHRLNVVAKISPNEDVKITRHDERNSLKKNVAPATDQVFTNSDVTNTFTTNKTDEQTIVEAKEDIVATLKISSLSMNPKLAESKNLTDATAAVANVVTIGSVPVKVNGFAESSGVITFGTIPHDPKVIRLEKGGTSAKNGSQ
ncbi:YTH domain-containing protein [Cephalotus follicularis]|uniref:YTH domain-containing family protein n=1 Tax=Cephalotus follicularis TaxID=3775 RepID=A0A1Q3BUJ0_CEPFO|nr:YTH domain-containing protein [Cephalotus follicularis]